MILKSASIGKYKLYGHLWILCLRILAGSFILTHGLPKLTQLLSGNEIHFIDPFGLGTTFTIALVVFAEVLCAIFIILGLFTRLATIPLMISLIGATLTVHAGQLFAQKELAYLYLILFATLFVFGSGKFSIDVLYGKKQS
ncbi:MAG: DoxX family protein [Crocinitomicaceae bacterium]